MPRTLTSPITGTSVWYFGAAPPAAAPIAGVVTQSLPGRPVAAAVSAMTWANGVVTATVPAQSDPPGSIYPITVSGVTPAGYNGSYQGTVAGPTTITYPLASNPGAVTVQGSIAYNSGFDLSGQVVPFYNVATIDPSAGTITARNGIGFYYGQRPASSAWCTMPRVNEPIAGTWPSNQEALEFAEHDLSPAQKQQQATIRIKTAEEAAAKASAPPEPELPDGHPQALARDNARDSARERRSIRDAHHR